MKIRTLIVFAFLLFVVSGDAQVLFSYGNHQVSADEYLRSYSKNNNDSTNTDRLASMRNYLSVFINSRLTIQEAYNRKIDEQETVRRDVESFREQLSEKFMADPIEVTRLKDEAFFRSQKAIHVQHIFISFKRDVDVPDTVAAYQKVQTILSELKKGISFGALAEKYSDDPNGKQNAGDLGFITVFSLPYAMENLVYSLPVNSVSSIYRSNAGYHLFKNLEVKKAPGYLKLQQILLSNTPEKDAAYHERQRQLADSLYKLLKAGKSFDELASNFSTDNSSVLNNGVLPEITVGTYDPTFEKNAWALDADGKISKPFETAYGFHILKRISLRPIITDSTNDNFKSELQQKLINDNRWKNSRAGFIAAVRKRIGSAVNNLSDDEVLNFYRAHLEDYNEEFNRQITEIKEGSLYFELMQKEVWSRVADDSIGMEAYFNANKTNYKWDASASLVHFYCSNESIANTVYKQMQKSPLQWRAYADAYGDKVMTDSSRVSFDNISKKDIRANYLSPITKDPNDFSASFYYVFKLYPAGENRKYDDAKGLVMNDYQAIMESKWYDGLRAKYPVTINEDLLKKLALNYKR